MEVPSTNNGLRLQGWKLGYVVELQSWVKSPPRGDPGLSALSEAALNAYEDMPLYREAVNNSIEQEKIKIPSYQVNKQLTALISIASDEKIRDKIGWPEFHRVPETNYELIQDSFATPNSPGFDVLKRLPRLRYNKNEPGRAVVPAFFAGLMLRSGLVEGDQWSMQENGASG
jgi:hypothetical protein